MIPNLSKTAFWDMDFDKLDFEKNAVFIMEKVFNYGLWDDQLAIVRGRADKEGGGKRRLL